MLTEGLTSGSPTIAVPAELNPCSILVSIPVAVASLASLILEVTFTLIEKRVEGKGRRRSWYPVTRTCILWFCVNLGTGNKLMP